jgi:5-carboxymethyl-2-hydroxymuconate isomerase
MLCAISKRTRLSEGGCFNMGAIRYRVTRCNTFTLRIQLLVAMDGAVAYLLISSSVYFQ